MRERLLAAAGGVLAAFLILSFDAAALRPTAAGPVLSETGGSIEEAVLHYVPGPGAYVLPVLQAVLSHWDEDVVVYAAVPDRAAFEELRGRLGSIRCKLRPVIVKHPFTPWSRDRWLVLQAGARKHSSQTLLVPRAERYAEAWPERAGDARVAEDLAAAIGDLRVRRSELLFDAGDFAADEQAVFAAPEVIERNVQHTVEDEGGLAHALTNLLQRRIIFLKQAPRHHTGMFLMPAGHGRVVVGDPAAGLERALEAGIRPAELDRYFPNGVDLSSATQNLYDAAAKTAQSEGYRVYRVPALHGTDSKVYVSYTNVLIDEEQNDDGAAAAVVYLPVYQGLESLNRAAAAVWERLGYTVRPVDVSGVYREGGTVHCLINVLRRRRV